jgi:hypothetical protein
MRGIKSTREIVKKSAKKFNRKSGKNSLGEKIRELQIVHSALICLAERWHL